MCLYRSGNGAIELACIDQISCKTKCINVQSPHFEQSQEWEREREINSVSLRIEEMIMMVASHVQRMRVTYRISPV